MSYELKTKQNDASVLEFIESIEDIQKREDSLILLDIFTEISGYEAKMWGSSIIGFGIYTYVNSTKKPQQFMRTGFSPRSGGLSLYIMPGYQFENMPELMNQLGKYKAGKSCLNVKKLADIDLDILKQIIELGLKDMAERYSE